MTYLVLAATFVVMVGAAAAMAVGLLRGRRLKGSCGGTMADCECLQQGLPKQCEKAPEPIGHPRMPVKQPGED